MSRRGGWLGRRAQSWGRSQIRNKSSLVNFGGAGGHSWSDCPHKVCRLGCGFRALCQGLSRRSRCWGNGGCCWRLWCREQHFQNFVGSLLVDLWLSRQVYIKNHACLVRMCTDTQCAYDWEIAQSSDRKFPSLCSWKIYRQSERISDQED